MAELDRERLRSNLFGPVITPPNNMPEEAKAPENIVVPIDKMLDFHTKVVDGRIHPFSRVPGHKLREIAESIKENGLMYPIKLREDKEYQGFYEVIAGHNRRDAFKLLGRTELSTGAKEIEIVDADDETAAQQMIITNIHQREEIATMDKAWAYRIWMENNKRRVGRKNGDPMGPQNTAMENGDPMGPQKKSSQLLADETGESETNIKRLIRLTYLIEGLQTSVDSGGLQIRSGYELSFLDTQQQEEVLKYMSKGNKLSIQQAQSIREKAKEQFLSDEDIEDLFKVNTVKMDPMKTVFKQTEKRFKKYDQDKLARVDVSALEAIVSSAIDTYLAQI